MAEIIQGQRSIEISLAGYKTIYLRESFVAGTSRVLESFSLEPNDGTLALETRPNGATVTINGSYHGVTPTTIVLASGVSHQIKLRKPGYRASIKTTSLKPDEELQLVVDLPPEYGIIFANTNPAGVALTVDGAQVWDMRTKDGLEIGFGIYIYHITAPGVGKKAGKFAVIK